MKIIRVLLSDSDLRTGQPITAKRSLVTSFTALPLAVMVININEIFITNAQVTSSFPPLLGGKKKKKRMKEKKINKK